MSTSSVHVPSTETQQLNNFQLLIACYVDVFARLRFLKINEPGASLQKDSRYCLQRYVLFQGRVFAQAQGRYYIVLFHTLKYGERERQIKVKFSPC
jgi:hypothetical protein